jgi:HEAT repeat protein
MPVDDADRVRHELTAAGVVGVDDFGRFVSDTTHFCASRFDEKAAMPTLLAVLPSLTDPRVVSEIAGHLRRAWARPSAFPVLRDAFVRWSQLNAGAGWALGDALGTAADKARVGDLIELAADDRYGKARQMVVHSLRRFKSDERVPAVLTKLLTDPDVALHAAGALRHVLGNAAALPLLQAAREQTIDSAPAASLDREIKKAAKA